VVHLTSFDPGGDKMDKIFGKSRNKKSEKNVLRRNEIWGGKHERFKATCVMQIA
jgi:hypothetical protein